MALGLPETDIEHWIIVLLIILLAGYRLKEFKRSDRKDASNEKLIKDLFETIMELNDELRNITSELRSISTKVDTYTNIIDKRLEARSPTYIFEGDKLKEEKIKKKLKDIKI